mmetsp:Transcript_20074/g.17774  ORF Transcript_20074/g.17774 Transcript_20074/m.17774 type:complete len:81 (+) Transcript_20074:546-788(+)
MLEEDKYNSIEINIKIEKLTKTLLCLKVNRRSLITEIGLLIKNYRENISMRTYKINELDALTNQILAYQNQFKDVELKIE